MVAPHEAGSLNGSFTVSAETLAPERFDRAAYDPAHAQALQHAPSPPPDNDNIVAWTALLFGVFLVSSPLMDTYNRIGLLLHVMLGGFGLLSLALGVMGLLSLREYRLAPIERQVVVMLKHHVYESRGTHGIVSRHHRMLLALRTHELLDVSCSEELTRRIRPGDLGMAFLKLAVLVDFIPLRDDCQPTATATPPGSPAASAP